MQWWNDISDWFNSNDGQGVLLNVILPFLAIIVAGVIAAMIGRGSTKRLLALNDRENRMAAVAAMIGAARRGSVWNTLSAPEQNHADHVASEADVRLRLLAMPGSALAADWAAHEIAAMKKHSVSFSFQAEQSLIDFRERMVAWQAKPSRAKKLFKNDLELWAYEDSQNKNDLVSQQQAWAAAQVASETGSIPAIRPAKADITPARPAERRSFSAPAAASVSAPASAPATPAAPAAAPAASAPATSVSAESAPASERSSDVHTAVLVEPRPEATGNVDEEPGSDDRGADEGHESFSAVPAREDAPEDADRQLENSVFSPPVAANAVTKRINPPHIGDDGHSY